MRAFRKAVSEFLFCRGLAKEKFDLGFVFDMKDASVFKVLSIWPRVKAIHNRLSIDRYLSLLWRPHAVKRNVKPVSDRMGRYIDILSSSGLELDYNSRPEILLRPAHIEGMRQKLNVKHGEKIAVICSFGSSESRKWRTEKHCSVIKHLQSFEWFDRIIVIGLSNQKSATSEIITGTMAENAAGILDIAEAAALLGTCQLFISVDTGPMHIGDAMNVNMIGLYPARNDNTTDWQLCGSNSIMLQAKPVEGDFGITLSVETVFNEIDNKMRGIRAGVK